MSTVDPTSERRPHRSLAELVSPARTAVVVQELQEGIVGDRAALRELADAAAAVRVVPNGARVCAAARRAGAAVVHTTAEDLPRRFGANRNARIFAAAAKLGTLAGHGDPAVQPVAALAGPGDLVLPRYHGLSPMEASPLDSLLRNAGITTVVVIGVSLNVAIPALVFEAVQRSYQVVVVRDAVAGVPVEYGEQVLAHSLAAVATVVGTDELAAAWDHAVDEQQHDRGER